MNDIPNDKILEVILSVMPHPSQLEDFDTSKNGSVYFSWRGDRFMVDGGMNVNEVDGMLLAVSNIAIILRTLLKKRMIEIELQ